MRIILLQILFSFCFCLASGQGVTEINIPGLLKTERDPVLSEIASGIQLIKLQTTPECFIESVRSVTRWGNNLLISAKGTKALLIFSKDGKFIKSFGTIGKGPGEYLEIYGMALDPKTDHLYILDNGRISPRNTKDIALSKKFADMINQSSTDDNPILVIAALK